MGVECAVAEVSAPPRRPAPSARATARPPPYADLLEDPELSAAIQLALPERYHFEVPKTIWKLRKVKARHVGLQMPDGLLLWAPQIAEILRRFGPPPGAPPLAVTVLADVNFGACCIDDLGAAAIGIDFLVHYGHSCLVPVDQTAVKTLYVFVYIDIDVHHLVETVKLNFSPGESLVLMGTIQFIAAVRAAQEELELDAVLNASVERAAPLSRGEVLGCTAPTLPEGATCVFVCDGRFHLEAMMMQNRSARFFRYDPYTQVLTTESFAVDEVKALRRDAIRRAKKAKVVGLILGTLGRQGSVGVLESVQQILDVAKIETFILLLSEITKEKLALFPTVDAWVQVACPRLSIDWGHLFTKPLLSSYEAHACWRKEGIRGEEGSGEEEVDPLGPMDYYANQSGPWANYTANYGGSVREKFWHLSQKAKRIIEYE